MSLRVQFWAHYFLLFINDLPLHIKDALINIFADDTLLSVSGEILPEVMEN
jgi:hypothetical protein